MTQSRFDEQKSVAEGKRQQTQQDAISAFNAKMVGGANYDQARIELDNATKRADREFFAEVAKIGAAEGVSTSWNPER
jgi:hypothetical protein